MPAGSSQRKALVDDQWICWQEKPGLPGRGSHYALRLETHRYGWSHSCPVIFQVPWRAPTPPVTPGLLLYQTSPCPITRNAFRMSGQREILHLFLQISPHLPTSHLPNQPPTPARQVCNLPRSRVCLASGRSRHPSIQIYPDSVLCPPTPSFQLCLFRAIIIDERNPTSTFTTNGMPIVIKKPKIQLLRC